MLSRFFFPCFGITEFVNGPLTKPDRQILEEVINRVPELKKEYKSRDKSWHKGSMQLLLLYEFLFGDKKRIKVNEDQKGGSRIAKLILSHKNAISTSLARIKIQKQVANNDALVSNLIFYTYARVNTLQSTVNQVMYELINTHNLLFMGTRSAGEINPGEGAVGDIKVKAFWMDEHVPTLFGFTSNCKVAGFPLCIQGKLIIQNKSSCLPAVAMDPHPSWTVLDACAAPGNKTVCCLVDSKWSKLLMTCFQFLKCTNLLEKTLFKGRSK